MEFGSGARRESGVGARTDRARTPEDGRAVARMGDASRRCCCRPLLPGGTEGGGGQRRSGGRREEASSRGREVMVEDRCGERGVLGVAASPEAGAA